MLKNILLVTGVAFMLAGCWGDERVMEWNSFIYPDKNNTKRSIKSPMKFDTLEECRDASIEQISKRKMIGIATYKCGLNCAYHDGMKTEICEKMMSPVKGK